MPSSTGSGGGRQLTVWPSSAHVHSDMCTQRPHAAWEHHGLRVDAIKCDAVGDVAGRMDGGHLAGEPLPTSWSPPEGTIAHAVLCALLATCGRPKTRGLDVGVNVDHIIDKLAEQDKPTLFLPCPSR